MPQVFQVLKCYKCFVFQIHQTKKSNKFECKVCVEKQSIKRHYGVGTGKDCRLHVQRLNGLRGDREEKSNNKSDSNEECEDKIDEQISESFINPAKQSKWSAFVDEQKNTTIEDIDVKMCLGDREDLLQSSQKRKTRKFKVKTLNIANNTSGLKLGNNLGVNKVYNFESQDIPTSVQDCSPNNSHTKIAFEKELISICTSQSNSNKHKFPQQQKVLQTVSKNSKWSEFIAVEVENEDIGIASNKTLTGHLFTLCDDRDLDKVLEI